MVIQTIDVKAAGIVQGGWNHGQAGSEPNKCRCTNAFYLDIGGKHPASIKSTLTVSTGKTVKVSLMTFETASHTTEILTSGWQDIPYTMNISSSTASKYVLCEMRYGDSSNVTPEEILSWTITCDDGLVWHAAVGEYPINDNTLPKAPTNYSKPWANWLWRVDEGNDGYPYTELQLGVLHVDPGPTPPTPPPPPPPEEHGIPIVQPDGTHIIDDETSMYYLRYMNGYTNPNLYRFRDGELPENAECDVFIKGTHSHRYTSINDYEDFSTECEIP